jgi:hypothetical protein
MKHGKTFGSAGDFPMFNERGLWEIAHPRPEAERRHTPAVETLEVASHEKRIGQFQALGGRSLVNPHPLQAGFAALVPGFAQALGDSLKCILNQ